MKQLRCPHCGRRDFMKDVVCRDTGPFKNDIKNFNCPFCGEVLLLKVRMYDPKKTKAESEYEL